MPIPALIIERELELDRDVTPQDFTGAEREEILGLLPRCLQDAHRSLEYAAMGRPREVFRAAEWVGGLQDLLEVFSLAEVAP